MLDEAIRWIGGQFSAEQYLLWTRIQCVLWSLADLGIVCFLLRSANVLRRTVARTPHFFPYLVLAATVPFIPIVPFAPTGGLIFVLEIAITVPHFLLILYVLAANARYFAPGIIALLSPDQTSPEAAP